MLPCQLVSRPSKRVDCMHYKQKYGFCCDGELNALIGTRDITIWATGKHQALPEIKQFAAETFEIMQQTNDENSLSEKNCGNTVQNPRSCLNCFFFIIQMDCLRRTCKATGDSFVTLFVLTRPRTMRFFSFLARKQSYECIDLILPKKSRLSQEKPYRSSCQHLSAVLPAAMPTVAKVHNYQRRLFWGRIDSV